MGHALDPPPHPTLQTSAREGWVGCLGCAMHTCSTLLPLHVVDAVLFRLQVCLQLVQQFSSEKSTAVGMTLEFHRSCMLSFQQFGLKEIFTLCLQKLYLLQPEIGGA